MKKRASPVETKEFCHYGCGCIAKFMNGSGNLMCSETHNKCPKMKEKNSIGTKKTYTNGRKGNCNFSYDTLPQESKDKMAWSRGKFIGVEFAYAKGTNHKAFLIYERGHACEKCKNSEWIGEPITLELEHIDGDNQNNVKENLLLLCPNCHSQTPTWRGRNIAKRASKHQVSDADFIDALTTTKNIRQALIKLGLTPKGANYTRANELKIQLGM